MKRLALGGIAALLVLLLSAGGVLAATTQKTAPAPTPAPSQSGTAPSGAKGKGPEGHPAGCSVCHVPHSAAGERLWPYAPPSTTTKGTQLSMGSALCYSCHDGTLTSLGATFFEKDGSTHPIDVVPSDRVKVPKEFPLDSKGRITCASCHNPHKTAYDKYLRLPSENGELCVACHVNN